MTATIEDIWNGVGTDTNNNYETLTLTEIGISFYEACNYVNNI